MGPTQHSERIVLSGNTDKNEGNHKEKRGIWGVGWKKTISGRVTWPHRHTTRRGEIEKEEMIENSVGLPLSSRGFSISV